MTLWLSLSACLFALSLLGPLLVFALYPFACWLRAVVARRPVAAAPGEWPTVSLVVAVRNAEAFIAQKVENALAIEYPDGLLDAVFISDGSTDDTEAVLRRHESDRLKVHAAHEHLGKTDALNRAVELCGGDILVFSDADAMITPNAVELMVRHFADPDVGGVCGQRVIQKEGADLKDAQSKYIKFDSLVKLLESRTGSITSNDGKLYCVRRSAFRPIAPGTTDDLYNCLSVIEQRKRFVFEPQACALIRTPSRGTGHELGRRRRIVCRSLRGIFMHGRLLDPSRYGFYSFGLFINKVVRRLLPVSLFFLFVSSLSLAFVSRAALVFAALQGLFYVMALTYPVLFRPMPNNPLKKAASVAHYFTVGNYGTFLGVVDFLSGKQVVKWNPVKTD